MKLISRRKELISPTTKTASEMNNKISCNQHHWTILFVMVCYFVTLNWAALSETNENIGVSHGVNITNPTSHSSLDKDRKVAISDIDKIVVDQNQINCDLRGLLGGTSREENTGFSYLENSHRVEMDFTERGVQFGNRTREQLINSTRFAVNGCCHAKQLANIADQSEVIQTSTDNLVGGLPSGCSDEAVSCSFGYRRNSSTTSSKMDAVIQDGRSLSGGILSEAQCNEYTEIVKAIKWALNFVALLMTVTSVIVFARATNRNSATTFILALNIFGCLAALLAIAGYTLSFVQGRTSMTYLIFTLYLNRYTGSVCRRIVYLLNMMMSVQRLTVIALPFLARTKFRNSINLTIISAVVVITFAGHVYIPLSLTIEDMGGGKFRFGQSTVYNKNIDAFETTTYAAKCIFAFFPLAASLLANILLLAYLKRHSKKMEKLCALPKTDRRNKQVTLIVLVSSLSFTLLSLPTNTHSMVATYIPGYGLYEREHYLFLVVNEALLGLLTLGDITNFLSYASLSSSFRDQFNTALKPSPSWMSRPRVSLAAGGHDLSNSSSCAVTMTTRKY